MSTYRASRRRRDRCVATDLVRFRTVNDAKVALRAAAVARDRAAAAGLSSHRREIRWFECEASGPAPHYHLTTRPSPLDVGTFIFDDLTKGVSTTVRTA